MLFPAFPNEELGGILNQKSQCETLSLEGQLGWKSEHPHALNFLFPNPENGTELPLLWKQVFQYLFLHIFGMPVLLIPYSLNKQKELIPAVPFAVVKRNFLRTERAQ